MPTKPGTRPKTKEGVGRPTMYNDTFPEKIKKYASEGYGKFQIAELLGISHESLFLYLSKYPEFSDGYKQGEQIKLDKVVRAMERKAFGYKYTETKIIKDAEGKVIRVEENHKTAHPDATTQTFILKNKRSEEWKEKSEIEHSGAGKFIDVLDKLE